jgi:glycosyltransferase involved in cell wall biosynthesis
MRSNAALYYRNYPEFELSLELLLSNDHLRQVLGQRGKKYVRRNFTWKQVLQKYRHLLAEVTQNPWW